MKHSLSQMLARAQSGVARREVLATFPLLSFGAWLLGEWAMVLLFAGVLPALLALTAFGPAPGQTFETFPLRGMDRNRVPGRTAFAHRIDEVFAEAKRRGRTSVVILVALEDVVQVQGKWGADIRSDIADRLRERIIVSLRDADVVAQISDTVLGIALSPIRRADLEIAMGVINRIQAAVAEPVSIDGKTIHVTASFGICRMDRAPRATGDATLAAAECALQVARKTGSEQVRNFTPELQKSVETEHQLTSHLPEAFDQQQIRPWFQPQVSADTGAITGFEALARWHHPTLGLLSPHQFLPAIDAAHAHAQLGEAILTHSLRALRSWDRGGLEVPNVGINISLEELRDPRLADRIKFEVDRQDLTPDRLCIEILESVTLQSGDEAITRNLRSLAEAGFRLDLDDFGTGHASISHIARFGVGRIKIDRSFIRNVDKDPEQKRLVAAILSMAEQLGVETLAEGVETPGEHSTVAQLGCDHLQGFGLARPMPFEETIGWIKHHAAKIATAQNISRRKLG